MSKLNIFNTNWVDMVFEGRNKSYGAYQLRLENPKTTVKAFVIGALIFSVGVAAPLISKYAVGDEKEEVIDQVIEVVDLPPPPVEEPVVPPPPPPPEQAQAPKSLVEEVKFKPLEVKKKEQVVEEPPKTTQFQKADPSSRNAEASPTGDINIGKPAGDLDKGQGVETVDNNIYNYAGLEVGAEFPGGMNAFNAFVSKNLRLPDVDQDLSVKVFVYFVVEKDGSMSNIKVTRDPGYGLGKEAERVLKSMKQKWKPGVQNGKNVRVAYSLPIAINIKGS